MGFNSGFKGLFWLRTATSSGLAAKTIIGLQVPQSAGNYTLLGEKISASKRIAAP